MERKTLKFNLKELDEATGEWKGYASVFRKYADKVGDIADQGCFAKTINDNNGEFVSFFPPHDIKSPVGLVSAKEDGHGLWFEGKLTLGVQKANEALLLMKAGVVKTVSIGYDTIKSEFKEGVRHLKEVRLYDISPVVGNLAADDMALITSVKTEGKPFPNEHSCRLRNPDEFQPDTFKRITRESEGKEYSIIMARLKGEDTMIEQTYRYDKDIWPVGEARAHCKKRDGTFEAAGKALSFDEILATDDLQCQGQELIWALQRAVQGIIEDPAEQNKKDAITKSISEFQAAYFAWLEAAMAANIFKVEGQSDATSKTLQSQGAEQLTPGDKEAARLDAIHNELKARNDGFDAIQAARRIEAILLSIKGEADGTQRHK